MEVARQALPLMPPFASETGMLKAFNPSAAVDSLFAPDYGENPTHGDVAAHAEIRGLHAADLWTR